MERDTDTSVVETIERHLPALERYVRSMVRDADEAADVCQEACVRLLIEAREAGLPDAPGAWLNRVAHNLVVSAARRRQTAERRADQLVERHVAAPLDQIVIDRERDERIRQALASARDDDRVAMTMAASGFGTRDIADRLGRTELATRALLCRARGRMRQTLGVPDGASLA
ncbi:MAG TPA: sigma-70 family RNA polymerase sigma factor [Candidatus Limnocylindrales bacterium]|nr:sigma-70 family RNA polymerase sigma factor [Candidatus Limnocylindrales bacterium]